MASRNVGRRRRALVALSSLVGLCALGDAAARTVRIVQAQALELRRLDGQELVIISGGEAGTPVELRVDDDLVRAARVEYNRTRRTLTLVGAATYRTAKDGQTLQGENLVVDLAAEQLTGEDVLISDGDIEIRGSEVERIPGQLRATGGYFTPCAKCGRTPNDYAFRAERLIVYPGDRLVAYRAQFLLVDVPVLYLPVVVIPLNDPERQPRLAVGQSSPDGLTVEADLPFSIGASTLGTTLLRYYENRDPSLGLGVALRSYAPLPFVDRVNLYTLANPKPFAADGTRSVGYDVDLDFSVRGRVPLALAVRDLDYRLNVNRRDIGRSPTDPERGVTRVDFSANVEYPLFSAQLNYLDRYGPEPRAALTTPLRQPEVVVDPKPYTQGNFSADFKVTAGLYTAQSNPLSRSASLQGVNITTTRLEEQHTLTYSAQPWRNADLTLRNTFTGRYYGTGARTVQLDLGAQLTQRFNVTNTFTVRSNYLRIEGTSPFAFDALRGRVLSAPLTLELNTVPVPDVTFGVSYTRDLFLPWNQQAPATFRLNVNRAPVNLTYNLSHNFATQELESTSFNLTLGDGGRSATPVTPRPGEPLPFRVTWPAPNLTLTASGGYTRTEGFQPFTVRATVTGDNRANNFSVYATHDIQTPRLRAVGVEFSGVGRTDTVLNPISFTGRENLNLLTPRLTGSYSLTWRSLYTVSHAHDLALEQAETVKESGTMSFSVGTAAGRATNWQLTYGGPYDLRRGGFTRPTVTGNLTASRPGQRLALSAVVNTPGLDQPRTELARADVNAEWQFGTRVALSGRAAYTRSRTGTYPGDIATDTLILDPLRVGIALGNGPRPGAYLTGSLRQTLTWRDGERLNPAPLAPVIGLTIDRCCWALQAEIDLSLQRYRLGISLPGSTQYPLFEYGTGGLNVPLLPGTLNPGNR
ncbi:autotransporter outer membrane beta-barrel domain-containing protein [Deinococcus sp. YIM 77859]|uniref:autotransporter outer membrane beta-barrel domain-containing protein n=1 Tax=Deinococcus sp. YIM 77859 TaxID=1540221 RepID=UPI000550B019|nr:autotransporter outer membrane beta-barrel domain-containing protein [Deinococcus sp. YIM 77859]